MSGFQGSSMQLRSQYDLTFTYSEEFKQNMREHDYEHHLKRDFHTVYNEAYVWMKPHLRK